MKITKKIFFITSLASLAIACLMLILAIFSIPVFEGIGLRVLLAFATLAVGGGVSISEINVLEKRKILGCVSLGFLGLSVLLALLSFLTPLFEVENFNRALGVVALFSVFMSIIISLNTKLEKRYMPLQIITYVAVSIVGIALILLVCGISVLNISGVSQMFWVLCVVSVGLLIATSVIGAKKRGDDNKAKEKATSELEALKIENQKLKAEIEQLKAEIETLKK